VKNRQKQLIGLFILWLSLFLLSPCIAQKDRSSIRLNVHSEYKIWLNSNTGILGKGELYSVLDDSLSLLNVNWKAYKTYPLIDIAAYPIKDIKEIQLRKKAARPMGIIIGSLSGLFMGGAIGKSKKSTSTSGVPYFTELRNNMNTIGGGVIGMISGGVVGGLIGSIRMTIPINGDIKTYHLVQHQLKSISKLK
jgi:hypothetical protein